MGIPNVTMRWCTKTAKCHWCGQPIECGTPMVVVFFWNKGNEESRKWNSKQYYHPQHWLDQGLDYLAKNPYTESQPTTRGRKPLALTPEQARQRFLLVRRYHALEQRKHKIKSPYPDNVLIESRLNKQMVDIMLEMVPLGGIPKNWVEKLVGEAKHG